MSQIAEELGRADFGDPIGEAQTGRASAAVALGARQGVILIEGRDRGDFLHRLLTSGLAELAPGNGREALLLDTKGHVVAHLDVWAERDRFLALTAAGVADLVVETLKRYVLGADVRLTTGGGSYVVLEALGPAAAGALAAIGVAAGGPGATAAAGEVPEVAGAPGTQATWLRTARRPGVEIVSPANAASAHWKALQAAGLRPLGQTALEVLRVEAGSPSYGRELTGDEFPQEAGLDGAVDYDKGCYLGQETVARIHYRGQVNRLLAGVRLEQAVPVGTALVAEGRAAGTLTSVVESDRFGAIGLGYLRRELAEPGTALLTSGAEPTGSVDAVVSALPFA